MGLRTCSKCDVPKLLSDFGKHRSGRDGLRAACKQCEVAAVTAWRRTEGGAAWLARYRALPNVRESMRAAVKRWVATESGKATKRIVEARHPDRRAARRAVDYALRSGRLVRADRCSECRAKCSPHGHHDDYTEPLKVRWLCAACHSLWHKEHPMEECK